MWKTYGVWRKAHYLNNTFYYHLDQQSTLGFANEIKNG